MIPPVGQPDRTSGSPAPSAASGGDARVSVTRELSPDAADAAVARAPAGTMLPSIMPSDLSAAAGTSELQDPLLAAVAAAPETHSSELEAGMRVGEAFRIERRIGAGGMGVVYLARDESLDRLVAVKLHKAGAGVDRLQREAMAMARLTHPNVITVHEVGRLGDRVFVAMEFVSGGTLRSWLKAKPRTWQESLAVCLAAGDGLAAAHDAGLVHRDFKPENVLVGDDGRARVGDFGLARAVGDSADWGNELRARGSHPGTRASDQPTLPEAIDAQAETVQLQPPGAPAPTITAAAGEPTPLPSPAPSPAPSSNPRTPSGSARSNRGILSDRLTMTGVLVGTPAYMAPEQFAGADVDAKADQFAFAVMTWEALHGKRPFSGSTADKLRAAVEQGRINPPPRDSAVPARVRAVLTRALAVQPADRWPSMHALIAALRTAGRPSRRGLALAAGGIALVAGAAIAWAAWPRDAADPCANATRTVDTLVPPAMLARMLDAVAATPGDRDVLDRIQRRLVQVGPQLRTAAIQSCRAAKVDRDWSNELYERSQACLALRARATAILIDEPALAASDPAAYAMRINAIPGLATCGDAVALAAAAPRRDEPAIAARALLWAAGADVDADRFAEARDGIKRAAALAPPDDRGAAAMAKAVQGRLAYAEDRFTDAARMLADAYYDGVSLDDSDIYLDALMHLIALHADDRVDAAAGEPWIRAGTAAIEKDRRRALDGVLAVLRALVGAADRRGEYQQSVAWAQQLDSLAPETLIPAHRAEIDLSLAKAYGGAGRFDDAIAAYRKAIDLYATAYGPAHPRTAEALTEYGLVLVDAGKYDEVTAVAAQARTALAAMGNARSSRRAAALLNFGVLLTDDPKDYAEAEASYTTARAIFTAIFGPEHVDVAQCDANLAVLEIKRGNPRAAIAALDRALAIQEKAYGPDHLGVGSTVYNLAAAAVFAGEYDRAEAAAARAENIFARHRPNSGMHLFAMTRRARALSGQGHHAAALDLARRADRIATEAGEGEAGLSAYVEMARAQIGLGEDLASARAMLDAAHAQYSKYPEAFAVTLADVEQLRSKLTRQNK